MQHYNLVYLIGLIPFAILKYCWSEGTRFFAFLSLSICFLELEGRKMFLLIYLFYITSNMVHVEGPSYGFRTDFVLQECPGDWGSGYWSIVKGEGRLVWRCYQVFQSLLSSNKAKLRTTVDEVCEFVLHSNFSNSLLHSLSNVCNDQSQASLMFTSLLSSFSQVFDILLQYHKSGSWVSALHRNITPKNGFV